jgi:type IV pilus assembly protein PilB
VVVTGPTGSGKTNTLNTIFAQMEEDDTRVILELGSPIEIESPRRVQITIRETASEKMNDLLYQQMFKAAMRFDPDVIAFTEIRNADEARIAFRAANTGHLVFTTMHAADVEETFGRMFEMGLDRSIVAKGILAIVAQTLIRRLCESCKVEDFAGAQVAGFPIYRENESGCDSCDGGFAGRTAVAEVLLFNDDVRDMIAEGLKPAQIVTQAVERGYLTPLKRVALGKLQDGVTSETEVVQLVQLRTEVNAEAEVISGDVWGGGTFDLSVQEADFIDVSV